MIVKGWRHKFNVALMVCVVSSAFNDMGKETGSFNGASVLLFVGMNKLLQRLPDNSREEVRNQAIVLIQQLTSRNEEMKKTVVFNEV